MSQTVERQQVIAFIRDRMTSLNLSSDDLAKAAGFQSSIPIDAVLDGKMRLPLDVAHRIAPVLEVEPAKLVRLVSRQFFDDEVLNALAGPSREVLSPGARPRH